MTRTRRTTVGTLDSSISQSIAKDCHEQGIIAEEIEGLIKVYKDGYVERSEIVAIVSSALDPKLAVTSRDVVIDQFTHLWARFYVPKYHHRKLPLIVYFHGGGFCVGSAGWRCYHEFLAVLAAKVGCIIMSVNYRLAPENPLPAAYDDGIKALMWLRQQSLRLECDWWARQCNFSRVFLAGDSAGANIAYNVVERLGPDNACQAGALMRPLNLKGTILIQPFFGGEARTNSEMYLVQSPRSALSLSASDTYWRIALPSGANRDHPWCNPLAKGSVRLEELMQLPIMVCISDMDILKDRSLEFVAALGRAGKRVEHVVHKGVGHAFQILSRSQLSQDRTLEMMSQVKAFIGADH